MSAGVNVLLRIKGVKCPIASCGGWQELHQPNRPAFRHSTGIESGLHHDYGAHQFGTNLGLARSAKNYRVVFHRTGQPRCCAFGIGRLRVRCFYRGT